MFSLRLDGDNLFSYFRSSVVDIVILFLGPRFFPRILALNAYVDVRTHMSETNGANVLLADIVCKRTLRTQTSPPSEVFADYAVISRRVYMFVQHEG